MRYENWVFGRNGALLSASARGDVSLVESLIKEGANIDVCSPSGFSALHRAAENGHAEVVRILISSGANAFTTALDGSTPASAAKNRGHDEIADTLEKLRRN